MPEYSWISKIHASEHNAGTAIIVVDQHRMNDFRPYIFMTDDFGKTWKKITSNLPSNDYVKVVRQDPHNPNLLFAGMEHGIFASWNLGKSWEKINNNLPNVSIRDLRIQARDRDLVVATHGRGVFILDDIHPIEELKNSIGKPIHLFPIREATLWNMYWRIENLGDRTYAAKNPEYGTYINFSLHKDAKSPVNIDILDKNGSLVTSLEMKEAKKGINRVVWDLGYDAAATLENKIEEGFSSSEIRPKVVPGEYTARVNYEGLKLEEKITVVGDNRIKMPIDDYRKKLKALLTLRDLLSRTHKLIDKVSFSADQLEDLIKKLNDVSSQDSKDAMKIHKKIVEHKFKFLMRPPPSMTYRQKPRLREEIRSLMSAIDNTTNPPTAPQIERIASLIKEVDEQEETILSNESELLNLNRKLSSLPQIIY